MARRNTERLQANGAREVAAAHYPLIVVLHSLWLAGLWLLAWDAPVSLAWLVIFALLQVLRFWTLGRRWTTRIIVVPRETLVVAGPYRLLRHPNYLVVVGEIAVFAGNRADDLGRPLRSGSEPIVRRRQRLPMPPAEENQTLRLWSEFPMLWEHR